MPDITMCQGETCPESLRSRCYRYTAIPNSHHQPYFSETPFSQTAGRCNYFEERKVLENNLEKKQ